jgi:hypothetical protein
MSTARENFKLGFIKQCAVRGLNERQTLELIAKLTANLEKSAALSDFIQAGYDMLSKLPGDKQLSIVPIGITSGLLGALGTGGAIGYFGRKLQGDYLDPETIKKKELIDTYRALAQKVRRAEAKSLGLS